ncbi:MFS transporter [Caldicellulosiruptor diazotrophicus]|uniref:MFS transporter n=1 Tax=Caldicellulosiruptor diazotrophicus TaxID=2806205 RepID=A0ABN6ECA9_9FIRM|nr:MFS transporter [Caldicellulosiruptor diazotrophicus]
MFPLIIMEFLKLFEIKIFNFQKEVEGYQQKRRIQKKYIPISEKIALDDFFKIVLYSMIGSAAIHYFFFYIIFLTILFIGIILRIWKLNKYYKAVLLFYIRKYLIMIILMIIGNIYWFLTYSIAILFINIEPQNVNVVDTLQLFSRNSSVQNVLYLISYWLPFFNLEMFLDKMFWIAGGVFLLIIAYIIFYRFGWHFYVRLFTIVTSFIILLSLGTNVDPLADIYVKVVMNVPIIGHIFRDPNKLVGVLACFLAIILGFGIDRIVFFLLNAGFGRKFAVAFVIVMLICFYFYQRPIKIFYIDNYYKGVPIPKEYKEISQYYSKDGKILWIPSMDNMVLSNGISAYRWNINKEMPGLMKAVGDFHVYASSKNTIFQHENNVGTISYFYSYLQHLLDKGGTDKIGRLLELTGFNQVAYHKDVQDQEERQGFNLFILGKQKEVKLRKKLGFIYLYDVKKNSDDVQVNIYNTKGLNHFVQLFDFENILGAKGYNIIWSQGKREKFDLEKVNLVVGDNRIDIFQHILPEKYMISLFDKINTGNPYVGWAKSMCKESDWFWIHKVNSLNRLPWDYDYGEGFIFTYTPYTVELPTYKLNKNVGELILNSNDIVKTDFFEIDKEETNFKLEITKDVMGNSILAAEVAPKKFIGNVFWKIARSKLMSVKPGYISLRAVVSGVNAGKVHFKLKFFNENMNELGVVYGSVPGEVAEFNKALINTNAVVPPATKYMRVELWLLEDQKTPVYFWIHDFELRYFSSISSNELKIKVPSYIKGKYHLYVRALVNENGGVVKINDAKINLKGDENQFKWLYVGKYTRDTIVIRPEEGFVLLNLLCVLPDWFYKKIQSMDLKSKQAIVLFSNEFALEEGFKIKGLENYYVHPNFVDSMVDVVGSGIYTKKIDILRNDSYRLYFVGNITSKVAIVLKDNDNKVVKFGYLKFLKSINNNFNGIRFYVSNKPYSYFLSIEKEKNPKWSSQLYGIDLGFLKKGQYTLEIKLENGIKSLTAPEDIHVLHPEEVKVNLKVDDTLYILISNILQESVTTQKKGNKIFSSKYSDIYSDKVKYWLIYGTKQIKSKKNELYYVDFDIEAKGMAEVSAKILFMDKNKVLYDSQFIDIFNNRGQSIFSPKRDGFVQIVFFVRSNGKEDGVFELKQIRLLEVSKMNKFSSVVILPYNVDNSNKLNILKEAYNPLWTNNSEKAKQVNIFLNGFYTQSSKYIFGQKIQIAYVFGLLLSIVYIAMNLCVLLRRRK